MKLPFFSNVYIAMNTKLLDQGKKYCLRATLSHAARKPYLSYIKGSQPFFSNVYIAMNTKLLDLQGKKYSVYGPLCHMLHVGLISHTLRAHNLSFQMFTLL